MDTPALPPYTICIQFITKHTYEFNRQQERSYIIKLETKYNTQQAARRKCLQRNILQNRERVINLLDRLIIHTLDTNITPELSFLRACCYIFDYTVISMGMLSYLQLQCRIYESTSTIGVYARDRLWI